MTTTRKGWAGRDHHPRALEDAAAEAFALAREGFADCRQGNPGLPFGGVKQSGFGRLRGPEGLLGFTTSKAILIDRPGPKIEANWYPYTEEKLRRFNRFVDALYTAPRPRLPAIAWHGLGLERFSQKPRR
jgi:hypothetical protein